jgi:dihydroorotate dehydrogenase electron transfer subunit
MNRNLPHDTIDHPRTAARGQFTATVVENAALCHEHWRLELRVAGFGPSRAGQFIQVSCRDVRADYDRQTERAWDGEHPVRLDGLELAGPVGFLRRPFSLAGRRDTPDGAILTIIHRAIGTGTKWLSGLRVGDPVGILGPLGNHFEHPPANGTAILVGGGVGIPPMLYLAAELSGREAVVLCGALTRRMMPLTVRDVSEPDALVPAGRIEEFARHGIGSIVTTDDGSYGYHGLVTAALEAHLDRLGIVPSAADTAQGPNSSGARQPVIYTCGPEAMMRRVAQIAAGRGIECQVAAEQAMACGMGTCQSCVIRVKREAPAGQRPWVYRLACTDGPVFRGADVAW